jgi:thiol-disulfide isomerase/thioredoxin
VRRVLRKLAAFVLLVAATFAVHGEDDLGIETLTETVPPFVLINAAGGPPLVNHDLLGKTVLLHFWASWCEPCKTELPTLQQLATTLDATDFALVLVAIDTNITPAEIQAFARGLGVQLPIYLAGDGGISESFWGWGLPVSYLLDKQGHFIGRLQGPRRWADPLVQTALGKFAKP